MMKDGLKVSVPDSRYMELRTRFARASAHHSLFDIPCSVFFSLNIEQGISNDERMVLRFRFQIQGIWNYRTRFARASAHHSLFDIPCSVF